MASKESKAAPAKNEKPPMSHVESLTAEPKEGDNVLVPERQATHKCVKCGKMWRDRLESRAGECECDGI